MSDKQFVEENHAKMYCSYRKDTPVELVEKIILYLKEKYDGPFKIAADVGCGAGQSTVNLAPHFEQVYGLDVSEAQIRQAEASRTMSNLKYAVSPAEELPFTDGSVQLVTVATALHWFDLERFMPEVRRVLCDNGVLAVSAYMDMRLLLEDPVLADEMDQLFVEYYETLDPYLHPNVQIVKDRYKSVNFPFEEVIRAPDVRCTHNGRSSDILNYASTFSGLQNYRKVNPEGAENCIARFQESKMESIRFGNRIQEGTNLLVSYTIVYESRSICVTATINRYNRVYFTQPRRIFPIVRTYIINLLRIEQSELRVTLARRRQIAEGNQENNPPQENQRGDNVTDRCIIC